jgi:dynein heavy chain
MGQVKQDPRALSLRGMLGLKRDLDRCSGTLIGITKNLTKYLESKQRYFPRFYFLPNEDLIEILGDSHEPKRVQVHLSKIFEGVESLTFTTSGNSGSLPREEISQMVSRDGETVDLFEGIFPLEYDGQVECWLLELERQVKLSTRKIVAAGLADYPYDTADG